MIVTCAKCATQFQLDEARVPESGIPVRCSVCKHAFFVQHPDALGEVSADPVTRTVEEVLEAESPELPEALHDLEAADAQPASGVGLPGEAHDDEDWEWSDDGGLSEPAAEVPEDRFEESFEAARAAVDDLLGSPEVGPDATLPAAPAAEPEPEPRERPAPAMGLDSRAEEAPLPLADDAWDDSAWSEGASEAEGPGSAPLPGLADGGEGLATGIDTDPLETSDGELDPFADELADPPEEALATPDELDLDELDAPEPLVSLGLDAPSGLDLEEPPEANLAGPVALSRAVESLPVGLGARLEPERRRALPEALLRAGSGVGWSVVTVLAAVMLWASVTPRRAPGAGVTVQVLAGLEATGVEGRWVENAIVGPIYVVRGELRNAGAEPRAPGARLVVRLLDAEGSPLDAPGASLAPPAPAAWLREAHPRELRGAREAGAQQLAQTPLAPGASTPFEAVVESLPEAARRFDLAVAPPRAVAPPEGS